MVLCCRGVGRSCSGRRRLGSKAWRKRLQAAPRRQRRRWGESNEKYRRRDRDDVWRAARRAPQPRTRSGNTTTGANSRPGTFLSERRRTGRERLEKTLIGNRSPPTILTNATNMPMGVHQVDRKGDEGGVLQQSCGKLPGTQRYRDTRRAAHRGRHRHGIQGSRCSWRARTTSAVATAIRGQIHRQRGECATTVRSPSTDRPRRAGSASRRDAKAEAPKK